MIRARKIKQGLAASAGKATPGFLMFFCIKGRCKHHSCFKSHCFNLGGILWESGKNCDPSLEKHTQC